MSDRPIPLSDEEQTQLALLLSRMESPLRPDVFYALVHSTVSVALELVVFDAEGKILLEYRKDTEYDGFALPGTVLRNNEDVSSAMKRLLETEVKSKTSNPVSLGWLEIQKGAQADQDRYRHYIPLLYACKMEARYEGSGEFFAYDSFPENTLSHEKMIIEEVVRRLKESSEPL